jgi:hypothetical protein
MRERRKSKEKTSGSGATLKGKWPYYDIMNFLEYYLQRRNMTRNVPQTAAASVSVADREEIEIDDSELNGETTRHDQSMEGWSNKEQPKGTKRGKKQKLASVDIDQQYLESLKEIGKRMEETSNDSDRMFLLSLLPAMKELSPLDNMDFRVEIQEALRRKMRRHAARQVELMTSEVYERNATDLVAVVHQTGPPMNNTLYEIQKMPK